MTGIKASIYGRFRVLRMRRPVPLCFPMGVCASMGYFCLIWACFVFMVWRNVCILTGDYV